MRKCIERQSHNCRDVYAYDLENWCDGIPSVELVSSSEHWLLARAVGRSAPRPHRFRRMAPPLTGKSLILHPPTEGEGSMKRTLCSLLVATLPFGSVLADAPKSKNAKVTLVYQHEVPNAPGKSIKGLLVEYGPGV